MKEQLNKIKESAILALNNATNETELDAVRVKFLGKKGELTAILKQMGGLSPEERPIIGQLANKVRSEIEECLENAVSTIKEKALEQQLKAEKVDVTMPGVRNKKGGLHPLNIVLNCNVTGILYLYLEVNAVTGSHFLDLKNAAVEGCLSAVCEYCTSEHVHRVSQGTELLGALNDSCLNVEISCGYCNVHFSFSGEQSISGAGNQAKTKCDDCDRSQ